MQGYQRIGDDSVQFRRQESADQPPTTFCPPDEFIHGQVSGESDRRSHRWSHILDLDEFFTRVYEYHRRHGFLCILVSDLFELFRFLFVVVFAFFLFSCVDYAVLFKDKPPPSMSNQNLTIFTKISLADSIKPTCPEFNFLLVVCSLIAVVFWLYQFVVTAWKTTQSWQVKRFYQEVLEVPDAEIDNLTWHEIMQKLRTAQNRVQFCIHKTELSELEVYHRILRRKNYVVAFFNKNLLPPKFHLPIVGELCFFTNGFKFNFEFLFFLGWWSPWLDYWRLKPEYKKRQQTPDLARRMERVVLWLSIVNLVFSPVIFVWQIFYSFFSYGTLIKREPGFLGLRRWSIYGKYFFRHFNELDHELENRLSRGYKPAAHYMEMFSSSLLEIFAKNAAFFLGAPMLVLVCLSVYDEDVLQVEHVLTLITVFGLVVAACRLFIPDENLVVCPELMMQAVCAQVHYLPDTWRWHAHTECVRKEFSQMFQYTATFLMEELFSPLVTPFVLYFYVKPRCLEILEFFRRFTVEVPGLGDVCSFAQMDVQKHGDPSWQPQGGKTINMADRQPPEEELAAADGGKTEMSLMHFAITNPLWHPPTQAANFLDNLRECANRDINTIREHQAVFDNPLIQSFSSITTPYASPLFGTFGHRPMGGAQIKGRGVSRAEGPLATSEHGILASLRTSVVGGNVVASSSTFNSNLLASHLIENAVGGNEMVSNLAQYGETAAEMSLTSMYLREIHQRKLINPSKRSTYGSLQFTQPPAPPPELATDLWSVPREPKPGPSHHEDDEDSAPQLFDSV